MTKGTLLYGSAGSAANRNGAQHGTVVGLGAAQAAREGAERRAPAAMDAPVRRAAFARDAAPPADEVGPDVVVVEVAPDSTEGVLRLALAATAAPPLASRSTVLPRIALAAGSDEPTLVHDDRPRYQEVGFLGAGGVAEVTLAVDQDIGRSVAIKRLQDPGDRAGVLRFVDEVRLTGRLDHPNIVPLHDVGCDEAGRLYFVMKRMEGETLETILERLRDGDPVTHRRFPLPVRIEIAQAVLRAVEFAHAQRIVHRDLKPSNVMIGKYGEVVVMDWGIAKRLDDPISDALDAAAPVPDEAPPGAAVRRPHFTRVGTLLGTPAYMSPEQARGDTHLVAERSDLYSLAVVFYELFSLRHYLEDLFDLPAVLTGVRTRVPPPPALVAHPRSDGVPMELSNFVMRGMEKKPDERYQTASEMIEALQRVVSGTFPISCPVTLTKRALTGLGRAVDKHPRTVFFGVLGLALGAAGGLVAAVAPWVL